MARFDEVLLFLYLDTDAFLNNFRLPLDKFLGDAGARNIQAITMMYILSHNSLEREQVQALTMYFIITTMAWSRCRRRLEREQEGGA